MSSATRRRFVPAGLVVAAVVSAWSATGAQGQGDAAVVSRIRQEALANSQIMHTLHMLTDVHGPRLTGSPNLRGAQDWVVQQATAWGLANAHLEAWDFGHPGWTNEKVSAFVVSPVKDTLVVEVLAWTPGTNGTAAGQTVLIEPPVRPTAAELTAFFDRERSRVKGRMVMIGQPNVNEVTIFPPAKRRNDSELTAFTTDEPSPSPFGGGGPAQAPPDTLTAAQVAERLDQFLVEAGALVRLNDAGREHGQIRAFNNRTFDVAKAVPTLVVRNEDYGRLARIMADGTPVSLEVTITNRTYPEGATQHNVVAEIPGSDKAAEVVMLGGHLDSWHAATGSTDNAIGCAVMLEAIRILKAIGVQPRRTIRVALWSGEEQGLLGSQAYVKEHFGSFEDQKPEYGNFVGYFNIDSGTGRARGMTVFGPPSAAAMLRPALAPFTDNGLVGSSSTTSRRLGGSDHTSFNQAGLPGIGVSQDPIEYGTHTWHTNLDTYERVIESDAKASAMAIAAAVYHLAMADEQLPRLSPEDMPKPPSDR
ncbi:MAG: M20/M25/M40 family metallo-hydrolase [Vicinamibacterales bacterium]